jgi:hypothetical protein
VREEVRTDALAEAGTVEAAAGGMEVKKVTYLTGAENERRQLEKLLLRRADFTGQPLSADPAEAPAAAGAAAAAGAGHDGGAKPWKKRAPRVVGFGKELAEVYGLGARFDEQQDAAEGNERFRDKVKIVTRRGAARCVCVSLVCVVMCVSCLGGRRRAAGGGAAEGWQAVARRRRD